MAANGPIRVKGLNLTGVLRALPKLSEAGADKQVLAALPRELREGFQYGSIVASGWYPVDWYATLHETIGTVLSKDLAFAGRIGRQTTMDDFNSVYRFVTSLLAPETVFAQSSRLMSMYFQGGEVRVEHDPLSGSAMWRGWTGFTPRVWRDLLEATQYLIETTGAQNVRYRLLSGGTGPDADALFTWQPKR
jgi:hypothetical protein